MPNTCHNIGTARVNKQTGERKSGVL